MMEKVNARVERRASTVESAVVAVVAAAAVVAAVVAALVCGCRTSGGSTPPRRRLFLIQHPPNRNPTRVWSIVPWVLVWIRIVCVGDSCCRIF